MVQLRLCDRHKLFLKIEIGDEALPESAKKRHFAAFRYGARILGVLKAQMVRRFYSDSGRNRLRSWR